MATGKLLKCSTQEAPVNGINCLRCRNGTFFFACLLLACNLTVAARVIGRFASCRRHVDHAHTLACTRVIGRFASCRRHVGHAHTLACISNKYIADFVLRRQGSTCIADFVLWRQGWTGTMQAQQIANMHGIGAGLVQLPEHFVERAIHHNRREAGFRKEVSQPGKGDSATPIFGQLMKLVSHQLQATIPFLEPTLQGGQCTPVRRIKLWGIKTAKARSREILPQHWP
mmetsp:Transcript_151083/g.263313  ORF Transcript_151083/g.263313 Transcript_151083/m.263313 type:complete len:228 (-) Transcript_151083:107-790(-)